MEPTKRPWYVNDGRFFIESDYSGDSIAAMFTTDYDDKPEMLDNAEANAEFIVRAVNAHDDLVAACEAAKDRFLNGGNPADTIAGLRDAIRKAKGEPCKQ